jgi:hypothetical protein
MRIVSNRKGDYVQVLEDFLGMTLTTEREVRWSVVLYNGQVMVFHDASTTLYTKDEFIEYKDNLGLAQWRSSSLKEDRMKLFDKLLKSLIKWERELKIDEVLRDEMEYQYWVC